MTLEQLRASLQAQREKIAGFPATCKNADNSQRPMTKEELKTYNDLIEAAETLKSQISTQERAERDAAAEAAKQQGGQQRGASVPAQAIDHNDRPFKSFGEQLAAVASVTKNGDLSGASDRRLTFSRAAGANETIPSEGGFLVQEDFSTDMLKLAHESGQIISRVTNIPISSNSNALRMPIIDETSRAEGSRWGGVRAYWLAEGEQKIDSKPKFGSISLGLNKIAALSYATDELLQDSTAYEAIIKKALPEEIRFRVEQSIIQGNGVGQPLGILNSGACVIVPKEAGQAAGTVTFNNLIAMLEKLPIANRRNAVWLVNDSGLESLLFSLTLPGQGGFPIYLPQGMNGNTPGNSTSGTLLGRPVIPHEYGAVTGTLGDIILADLSEYITIDKGGIQSAESMHVRFIYDESVFRFVYRIDGKPGLRQPVTTANGGMQKSPFVVLATRA